MTANSSSIAASVTDAKLKDGQIDAAAKAMVSTMRRQRLQDFLFHKITLLFALSVLVVLVGIIVALIFGAWPAFKEFGPAFITTVEWDPVNDQYGALIAIVGTLATSFIALAIAFPISFGIALFLTEICPPKLKRPLGTAVELLAGVPSIIYGMWGLFIFAPLFADHVQPLLSSTLGQLPLIGQLFKGPMMGIGILTAGLILAVMIIPFISSVMRDVFEIVPAVLKESAYGLGCTKWEVMRKVVLPYTKTGVVGGVMLGLGRALGETMAVTFVIGNAHALSWSLFAPGNSIASTLANEFAEAESKLHVSSLFALALILFVITFLVLAAAKFMLMGLSRKEGAK
jgi:phosphate transport system permease protein